LLLSYLIENEGKIVSRANLVEATSGADADDITERTIDVHVRRLRAKISGYEDIIRAVRGQGYLFEQHPDVLVEG
jgi:DNA-binding response OmpR family regulator